MNGLKLGVPCDLGVKMQFGITAEYAERKAVRNFTQRTQIDAKA
jgi:hypothetical protein